MAETNIDHALRDLDTVGSGSQPPQSSAQAFGELVRVVSEGLRTSDPRAERKLLLRFSWVTLELLGVLAQELSDPRAVDRGVLKTSVAQAARTVLDSKAPLDTGIGLWATLLDELGDAQIMHAGIPASTSPDHALEQLITANVVPLAAQGVAAAARTHS